MKLKTSQKIIVALLAVFIVFAIFNIILVIGGCGATMLIISILLKSKCDNQPACFVEPNGLKPEFLGTFMRIGQNLLGAYKFRKIEDTWVSYTFFIFIIPLFPTGCYRVKKLGSTFNQIEWAIYGSEKSSALEILSIYLGLYGLLILILSIMFFMLAVLV